MSGLLSQVRISEKRLQTVHDVCTACTRSEPLEPVRCVSLDCPWFFQRKKVEKQAEDIEILQELIQRQQQQRQRQQQFKVFFKNTSTTLLRHQGNSRH
jgi:DNA polymerase zeta